MSTVIAFAPHRRLRDTFAARLDKLVGRDRLAGARIHTTKHVDLADLDRMLGPCDRAVSGVLCWEYAIWGRATEGGPVAETLGLDGHQSGTLFASEIKGVVAFVVVQSDEAVRAMIDAEAAA